MKKYKQFLFFLGLSIISMTGLYAQEEKLVYDLYANKVKMGKWEVSRKVEGEQTVYESRREVIFKLFFKTHRTETMGRAVYRNDTLLTSSVKVFVNGRPRRTFRSFRRGADFFYQEEGKPARQLPTAVTFSGLQLFFDMPEAVTTIYIDREGAFLPLRQSGRDSWSLKLPGGDENRYYYADHRLQRATLEEGILHTYLRLRKRKEHGIVMR